MLLATFNGLTIALLSMLGEYVVRTLNAVSAQETYHVVDRVSSRLTRHLLVIGGQRCGTTGLPRSCSTRIPTSRWPDRPAPSPRSSCPKTWPRVGWTGTSQTDSAHDGTESLLGEKSTSYLEMGLAAARAASVLGRADIVKLPRDPVRTSRVQLAASAAATAWKTGLWRRR